MKKGLFLTALLLIVLTLTSCTTNNKILEGKVSKIESGTTGGWLGSSYLLITFDNGEVLPFGNMESGKLLIGHKYKLEVHQTNWQGYWFLDSVEEIKYENP